MLVIHIGSPKTGTTAIQGTLKTNRKLLVDQGVSFVSAGRTNIAHNSMVKPLLKGRASDTLVAIRDEVSAAPHLTHVLSSEVFFNHSVARALAEGLGQGVGDVRIIAYIRRPDLFVEAMYKQKVKNGRIAPDPLRFLNSWKENLLYGRTLDAYADAFGPEAMRVRPFERRHLRGGDVVSDFLGAIGVPDIDGLSRPETPSNKTLSRAVSEHLGRVNKFTGFNTRVMIREIIAAGDPGTVRSGDVYDLSTRRKIQTETADDQARVAARYFPDLGPGFDASDLTDEATDPFPEPAEALELERVAADAVMSAVGRQANTE